MSKTSTVRVNYKNRSVSKSIPSIKINTEIYWNNRIKLLGINIDDKIRWAEHTEVMGKILNTVCLRVVCQKLQAWTPN